MNERIDKLIEECTSAYDDLVYDGTDSYMKTTAYFDKEKFAELIVRECIECARGAGLADDVAVRNGLGFNDGISEAVTHMKKHFGVER